MQSSSIMILIVAVVAVQLSNARNRPHFEASRRNWNSNEDNYRRRDLFLQNTVEKRDEFENSAEELRELLQKRTDSGTLSSGTNLLVNPGGEAGVLAPWVVGGSSTPQLDTGKIDKGITPHSGTYQFAGNYGASGTLSQTVPIGDGHGCVTSRQIDTGIIQAHISFWSQSLPQTKTDADSVTIVFLDANDKALDTKTTPEQASEGKWTQYSAMYSVPAKTRAIKYQMVFTRHTGEYLDAFIDDNSLIID